MGEYLSGTFTLTIPEFSFVVVDQLPPSYPTAIFDGGLAQSFSDGVKLQAFDVTRLDAATYEARLRLRLPQSAMLIPLSIELRGDLPKSWLESLQDVVVHDDVTVFSGPTRTSGTSPELELEMEFAIPAAVGAYMLEDQDPKCEIVIRSSRRVALKHTDVDYYPQIDFRQTVPYTRDARAPSCLGRHPKAAINVHLKTGH